MQNRSVGCDDKEGKLRCKRKCYILYLLKLIRRRLLQPFNRIVLPLRLALCVNIKPLSYK
jgi:hypothetical protein